MIPKFAKCKNLISQKILSLFAWQLLPILKFCICKQFRQKTFKRDSMKVTDAFWEERNLGVKTVELLINRDDSCLEIEETLAACENYQYCVAKVEVPNVEAQRLLSKHGFYYAESSLNMYLDVRNFRLSPLESRINKQVTYKPISSSEIPRFEERIREGIFDTDRIFLDSEFSAEKAAQRYLNWINDERTRGTELFEILYKDTPIGFFTQKQVEENTYYPFLAGLYKESNAIIGVGFSVLAKPIEDAISKGGKFISTYVSSNNLPIVRLHIQLGFVPNHLYSVFVKHNRQ